MNSLIYRLRGIAAWPSTTATVTATEIVSKGGRSGRTMNVYFSYASGRSQEDGKFFVDDNSSLYGLEDGEKFEVRYNPKSPSTYYSEEAQSLSMTIYHVIVGVGIAFAALVVIAQILAHR